MRRRWNGSIQSANTPVYSNTGMSREDYGMYRCMVTDVLYVDDDRNISKKSKNPEVLYEVVILGGKASGQTLSYCRLASYLDGDNNYSEFTLKKASKDISKTKLSDNDGDIVYVQFVQGHDAYPVIIGMARGINQKIGTKKADGPRFIEGYNGVETLIDNKGQRITTMKGGQVKDGGFKPGDSSVIKEEWNKDEKITTTFKSGLTVTADGKNDKVEIKTSGGVVTSLDGKGNKISIKAGSTEILIDGASGKISLKGDSIDLGSAVSDFVTKFTALASAFATHTHMVPQAPSGTLPSQPPMAPLLTDVGSQSVKVQS